MLGWDSELLLWIQEHVRQDWLTPVVKLITHLGDGGIIWIMITLALLAYGKTRKTGLLCSCSLLLEVLVCNVILKNWVARTRPYEVIEGLQRLIAAPSDFSFPSGHTGSSFAVAVVIFLMVPKRYGIPAMVLAVLIGLSRLYVGVHYPTDVLAAAFLGTVTAVLIWAIYRFAQKKRTAIKNQPDA